MGAEESRRVPRNNNSLPDIISAFYEQANIISQSSRRPSVTEFSQNPERYSGFILVVLPIYLSYYFFLSIYLICFTCPIYLIYLIYLSCLICIICLLYLIYLTYLSICLSVCLSVYLQAWKRSYFTTLPQFVILTTSKPKNFCEILNFWTWQHQKLTIILQDASTSKSGAHMWCFVHFDFEMCFAPQRRALFRHLNF